MLNIMLDLSLPNFQLFIRQRPLQPWRFFSTLQSLRLFDRINEDDRHGLLMNRPHHLIRFCCQK